MIQLKLKHFITIKKFEKGNVIAVTIEPQWLDELLNRMEKPWECTGAIRIELGADESAEKLEVMEAAIILMYDNFPTTELSVGSRPRRAVQLSRCYFLG